MTNVKAKDSIASLGSADDGVAVTPHVNNTIPATRAIVSGADGTAAVRFVASAADVSIYMIAGMVYPYSITAVRAAGTTATGIVALY